MANNLWVQFNEDKYAYCDLANFDGFDEMVNSINVEPEDEKKYVNAAITLRVKPIYIGLDRECRCYSICNCEILKAIKNVLNNDNHDVAFQRTLGTHTKLTVVFVHMDPKNKQKFVDLYKGYSF